MSGMSGTIFVPPINNSCERFTFKTVLVNPDTTVLPTLKIDDDLNIEIDSSIGIVAKVNGQIVGNVLTDEGKMDKLIECMDGGTVYKGTIIELDIPNGVCRIRISAGT